MPRSAFKRSGAKLLYVYRFVGAHSVRLYSERAVLFYQSVFTHRHFLYLLFLRHIAGRLTCFEELSA